MDFYSVLKKRQDNKGFSDDDPIFSFSDPFGHQPMVVNCYYQIFKALNCGKGDSPDCSRKKKLEMSVSFEKFPLPEAIQIRENAQVVI